MGRELRNGKELSTPTNIKIMKDNPTEPEKAARFKLLLQAIEANGGRNRFNPTIVFENNPDIFGERQSSKRIWFQQIWYKQIKSTKSQPQNTLKKYVNFLTSNDIQFSKETNDLIAAQARPEEAQMTLDDVIQTVEDDDSSAEYLPDGGLPVGDLAESLFNMNLSSKPTPTVLATTASSPSIPVFSSVYSSKASSEASQVPEYAENHLRYTAKYVLFQCCLLYFYSELI